MMVTDNSNSEARERVLKVAERLFSERGYAAVTLKDIANELGMRQASLYHHVPGGKEALFIEVTERGLNRHRSSLQNLMHQAGPNLQAQLHSAAHWLLSQPALNLERMSRSDMPSISAHEAKRLELAAYESLLGPLKDAFRQAWERGEIREANFNLLAGSALVIFESIHTLRAEFITDSKEKLVDQMIDVLLNGLRR